MDRPDKPLELLSDAEVLSDANGWALRRLDAIRYAADTVQTAIIQALGSGYCSLEGLGAVIRDSSTENLRDDEVSLAIARFILDFDRFLKD